MKGKIRVFCRVRPFSRQEEENQAKQIVRKVDDFTLRFKMQEAAKQGLAPLDKEQEFSFDACFGQHDSQECIFEDVRMLI